MSSPRWQQIKKIVDAALDRDPSERARFLDEACPDPEMRKEVDSLLTHEAEGFLDKPAPAKFEKPSPKETASSDLIGKTLSHYEIQEKLGRGGMGEVFLAQDQTLDRRVALKLLAKELEEDKTAKKRFLREAKSAAALDHPYICKIYEIGEAGGRSFIAMEYIGRETLADRLKREALSLADAQRIASEIAEALETAHRENIVHRDLKPSNIMLTVGGHVKVLDFGLAKRVTGPEAADSQFETASQLTGKGMTLGTLAYMSPEQLRGQSVDARSDVFSFGIVLYEMVAGTHPFSKATSMDTAAGILNLAPPPLTRYRADVPELLEHIVSKMLVKEPGERYQLVHDVRTDLDRVSRPAVPAKGFPTISIPRLGKKQLKIGAAAFAALALVTALAFWWDLPFGPSTSREGPPSVAVLPLTNISEDPLESDYLAAGIGQAVTSKLTQVGLRVTPWDTARRYRDSGRPAEAIARELNVDAVLVGTFQIAGDQILTNVSLVEAESGFQSWADIIVEPYEDIFRMQLRIATAVAESLKKELTGEEEEVLATPASRSVDAYDFYMQGAHIMQEGNQEATDVAFQYFTRAVELDPSLAEAHVGLGTAYYDRYFNGWGGGLEGLDQAQSSFETALELNPASMRARRGLILVNWDRGLSEACLIQGQEAARFGNEGDVETLLARAWAYILGGLPDRGLPLLREALELDPVNEAAHWYLAVGSFLALEAEQAIQAGDAYFDRFGDDEELHTYVGAAHQLLGHDARAREQYRKAIESTRAPLSSIDSPASNANLIGLLFSGLLYERLGDDARAKETWHRGVELLKPKLEAYPDTIKMRVFLACFYGLLGERDSFLTEEERALSANVNSWELNYLAAVRAKLGETERAIELLRRIVQEGRIHPYWERAFEVASVPAPKSEAFDQFLEEYETQERRLREMY